MRRDVSGDGVVRGDVGGRPVCRGQVDGYGIGDSRFMGRGGRFGEGRWAGSGERGEREKEETEQGGRR